MHFALEAEFSSWASPPLRVEGIWLHKLPWGGPSAARDIEALGTTTGGNGSVDRAPPCTAAPHKTRKGTAWFRRSNTPKTCGRAEGGWEESQGVRKPCQVKSQLLLQSMRGGGRPEPKCCFPKSQGLQSPWVQGPR